MRALRILSFGILGLTLAFLLQFNILGFLVGIALLPFGLLVIGQISLPEYRRAIQVRLEPLVLRFENVPDLNDQTKDGPIRLSGRSIMPSHFSRRLEFQVHPNHFLLLFLIGLFSLGIAVLILISKGTLLHGVHAIFELSTWWSLALFLAWRWLWERRVLRRNGVSLGRFRVSDSGHRRMKHVTYAFLDNKHERRGGFCDSLFVDREDDLTIVFFDEANPDQSVPASAMIFHKIVWTETA